MSSKTSDTITVGIGDDFGLFSELFVADGADGLNLFCEGKLSSLCADYHLQSGSLLFGVGVDFEKHRWALLCWFHSN